MLPLVQWTRGSLTRRRIRTLAIATVFLGLVGVNLGVLAGFRDFYLPAGRPGLPGMSDSSHNRNSLPDWILQAQPLSGSGRMKRRGQFSGR